MILKKSQKIFIVDIDGVACDHAEAICNAVNEEFGMASKKDDVTTWGHNFGPITFPEAVEKYYPNPKFIEKMSVTTGFRAFLEQISKTMKIIFASAREGYCQDATRTWIKKKFGHKLDVLFVKKKSKLGFDYLIDDHPGEVLGGAKKGKMSFLLSRPWNNNEETKNRLRKQPKAVFADNFLDVINFLKR